jgi:geranylgeranyl diphosphate synthase type II
MLVKDFQERSEKCHDYVKTSFLSEHIEHEKLQRALEYYFSYWNDFTHPGIFSIAFEAAGGKLENAVRPQAAMAMMAAAFDIHDDIIDGSKRKHGRLTVFGKFGQDIALLLGDAFLIKGFTLLSDSVAELIVEKEREVFATVKKCLFEVGNAHAQELDAKGKFDVSPDDYLHVLEMKAASIEADTHVAAIIAGGSEKEIDALREYGRILGVLATLREEFVDIFEVEELTRRVQSETLPIPIMLALQEKKTKEKIMKLLRKGKITTNGVDKLASVLLDTEPVARLKRKMEKLCERAISLAGQIADRKSKPLLSYLAQSMLEDL